jgi:amino acid transporter
MDDENRIKKGSTEIIEDLGGEEVEISEIGVPKAYANHLGEWRSTAICGNDITSSCLYVSSLSILAAGIYAPLGLLLVAGILFLYRKIYGEVGSALPLNGGAYTVLLNTTNKKFAAIAACLTILSYIATAVISASEAMHYAHGIFPIIEVIPATIALLVFFAVLNLLGITESSLVALVIFLFHITTLSLLVLAGTIFLIGDGSILVENWHAPQVFGASPLKAIFLGFSAAMLGISGFESSANFIEEQKPGVFPKTLRNMWLAVSVFNPLICLLALGLFPISEVGNYQNNLLAEMGNKTWGPSLRWIISIDAVLVLSGAVLTSYVGVIGLARRMTLDRCLPQFLLKENNWKKTNHWIIGLFCVLCTVVLLMTEGKVSLLAGVYAISFLCVMALFAIGNMLLKHYRGSLPRAEKAPLILVTVAFLATVGALAGNLSPTNLRIFAQFFIFVSIGVFAMFFRIRFLQFILFCFRNVKNSSFFTVRRSWSRKIIEKIDEINSLRIVYFSKNDTLESLNRAALYLINNEQSSHLVVIHVYEDEKKIPTELATELRLIDEIYPQFQIDFMAVKGVFNPSLIEKLSRRLKIPKNYMFIGTPSKRFPHRVAELGGVRLIL